MPSARDLWTAKLTGKPVRGTPAARKRKAAVPPALRAKTPFLGIVLGIDPSLRGTGLAVVAFEKNETRRLLRSLRVKNAPAMDFSQCLGAIFSAVDALLSEYPVTEVALEQTIYVQNFKTAQILGAARGAAICAAALRRLPVSEYPPLRVKQAVVGFGRAGKEQVARTLAHMLELGGNLSLDETDAVAVALCHAFTGAHATLR